MDPIDSVVESKIRRTDSCWFWMGGHNTHGRPYFKNQLVYRLTYRAYRGELEPGLVLDHVGCDNPRCVNPWHVEQKTQRENLMRANATRNLGQYATKGHGLFSEERRSFQRELAMSRTRDAYGRFAGG